MSGVLVLLLLSLPTRLCLDSFSRETGHNDYYKCSAYNTQSAKVVTTTIMLIPTNITIINIITTAIFVSAITATS